MTRRQQDGAAAQPSQFLRKVPGTRPATPVRSDEIPDDQLCTWAYRQPAAPGGPQDGFWELKYINGACLEHARLPVA